MSIGPVVRLLGVDYLWVATEVMEVTTGSRLSKSGVIITGPPEAVNKCDHCHRFDTVTAKAYSWEEAIARGWLVPEHQVEERDGAIFK